jgi:hypothetical protein
MVLARLIRLVTDRGSPENDGAPDAGALAGLDQDLLDRYVREVSTRDRNAWNVRPVDFEAGRAILDADRALQPVIVCHAIKRLVSLVEARRYGSERRALEEIVTSLCRRRLDYEADDLRQALTSIAGCSQIWERWGGLPLQSLFRSIDTWGANNGFPPEILEELERLRARGKREASQADQRKALATLDAILGTAVKDSDPFDPADDWGHAALRTWRALDPVEQLRWRGLITHAATASGAKPTNPWLARATEQIETIGRAESQEIIITLLGLMQSPARRAEDQDPTQPVRLYAYGREAPTSLPTAGNGDILKGLGWCCALFADAAVASAAGDAAECSFKKLSGIGPRAAKVGNACIFALGAMTGMHGVAQLQRLRQRVKQAAAIGLIDTALNAAAQREGMTREDLDDIAVPTFDLVDGRRREQFGQFAAEIAVVGTQEIEVRWYGADGRPRKSEPAEVKRQFGEGLKAFKRTADDLRKVLPAQRDRIERLPMGERSWPYLAWKERYLDHPLLSLVTRRLIWRFDEGEWVALGAWHDGVIVDAEDRPIDGLGEGTRVRLWHPIEADAATVESWQDWLERHTVTQPFKQAHREVYVLTDAERTTGTYSNRFASHILRQHQFLALCHQRGWRYQLQGGFDGANVPTIELPRWDLAVEYWVEPIVDGEESMSPSGMSLFVSSDQVRFRRLRAWEPIPLTEVPALVFSELMRDVDLFVAVCSVGNDPTWADQGPEAHRRYWHSVAFSEELSASGKTRRLVLERRVPRLKIAGRCEVTDKFLVVRGDLRTYKVHLGSGNILMEPNNQYLCIVPGRGPLTRDPSEDVFLPFEGDGQLAVILSKAFLLANDTAITDPTITRQLRR